MNLVRLDSSEQLLKNWKEGNKMQDAIEWEVTDYIPESDLKGGFLDD